MIKDVRKIKMLQSQLAALQGEAEALKIEISSKQKEYGHKKDIINKLKQQIDNLSKDKNVKISEHAIIRYFERVKGYDIEQVEKEIINEDVMKMVDTLGGNGRYPNKDFSVVMKDFTVTTIVK